jgi:hypothetical protein
MAASLSNDRTTMIMKTTAFPLVFALLSLAPLMAWSAPPERQAEVAGRGAQVMPFSLAATSHIFTKTAQGGIQRVVARRKGDTDQVRLVRQHLREIEAQFRRGDFSAPAQIHGADMPGLAQLRAAKPGAITISSKDVPDGAELAYRTADAALVAAIHSWFDAQVADHGPDATAGHARHHGAMPGR